MMPRRDPTFSADVMRHSRVAFATRNYDDEYMLAGMGMARAAGILSLVAFTSCHLYWHGAERFQSELRCNLSIEEVQALALRHGSKGFASLDDRYQAWPTHQVRQGSTQVDLWFDENRLQAFRQGRAYGLMGLKFSITINLCTGERSGYPMLAVDGPTQLKGAAVYLDGERLGGLSTGEGDTGARIGIPVLIFGDHEIRIEKSGLAPISRHFSYRPKSFWPEQRYIQIVIDEAEIRRAG